MPPRPAVLGDGSIRREKPLGVTRRCKPLHVILTLPRRPLRVFAAVSEITTLAVFHPGQDLSFRCAVALQLICNDDPRYILKPFRKLLKGFFAACFLRRIWTRMSRTLSA